MFQRQIYMSYLQSLTCAKKRRQIFCLSFCFQLFLSYNTRTGVSLLHMSIIIVFIHFLALIFKVLKLKKTQDEE
jgi:hypothetical protein